MLDIGWFSVNCFTVAALNVLIKNPIEFCAVMLITKLSVIVSCWFTGMMISLITESLKVLFQIPANFVASLKSSFVKLLISPNCPIPMVWMLSGNNNWPSTTALFL